MKNNFIFSVLFLFCLSTVAGAAVPARASAIDQRGISTAPKTEAQLVEIAFRGNYEEDRLAALEKISDPALLEKLARTAQCWKIRHEALQRLPDREKTAKIALSDAHWRVRLLGVSRLEDGELLARIAREDKASAVRKAALEKISDQRFLGETALSEEDTALKITAVGRITDQAWLKKIVLESPCGRTVFTALERIEDRGVLITTARENECPRVRQAAVMRLEGEEETLAEVALRDENARVSLSAVHRLESESSLVKNALESRHPGSRLAAVRSIRDRSVLLRAAFEDESPEVRAAAVRRIEDQSALLRAAFEDESAQVRAAAIRRVEDQEALFRAVMEDENPEVRIAAQENLSDPEFLALALETGDPALHPFIKRNKMRTIGDNARLENLAVQDQSAMVRAAAVSRLIWNQVPRAPGAGMSEEVPETQYMPGKLETSGWKFRKDPHCLGVGKGWHEKTIEDAPEEWQELPVPSFLARTDIGEYLGYGWYRARLEVPRERKNGRLILVFQGIDEQGWVFLNGMYLGEQSTESTGRTDENYLELWDEPFMLEVDTGSVELEAGTENTLAILIHASRGNAGIHGAVEAFIFEGD